MKKIAILLTCFILLFFTVIFIKPLYTLEPTSTPTKDNTPPPPDEPPTGPKQSESPEKETDSIELPPESVQEVNENTIRVILEPLYRATLSAETMGAVVKINKRMGEHFKKGDLLVQLDDVVFVALKNKALSAVTRYSAALSAKEKLLAEKIASPMEIKAVEADLAAAKSDLIAAKHAVNASKIRAPYDGKVVTLFVEEHELVQQGKPVIEIVDDHKLLGTILLNSAELSKLALGETYTIDIQETKTKVEGKVIRIDAVIDPASHTFKAVLEIDNSDDKLRAGMIGIITL